MHEDNGNQRQGNRKAGRQKIVSNGYSPQLSQPDDVANRNNAAYQREKYHWRNQHFKQCQEATFKQADGVVYHYNAVWFYQLITERQKNAKCCRYEYLKG